MATWEMKSVSVRDGSLMLGVMALATGKEPFEWLVCQGGEDHKFKRRRRFPRTKQLMDDPETMSKFALDNAQLTFQTYSDTSLEEILDDALRRGGSSLEEVREFDRQLIQEAKGTAYNDAKQKVEEITRMKTWFRDLRTPFH
jgi:polyhydroxyalkanoate synthesis regulator phasin